VSSPGPGGLRAVMFDMDGLLVDSEPLWFEVETEVMTRMGSGWSHADQQQLVGGSMRRTLGYMLARAARPAPEETLARWLAQGITGLVRQRGVPMMPGARELLAEVSAAGVPCALVTSAQRDLMEAVLEAVGVVFGARVFDVTVCAADVRVSKPDPEPYLRAAGLLGVHPGDCVALEDSPNGVASAEAAGCAVIAVPNIVPVPARPGRIIAASLREVDLARLREVSASRGHCMPLAAGIAPSRTRRSRGLRPHEHASRACWP
jgi:HAD superfamily hydrolase (TIGR01509 family)